MDSPDVGLYGTLRLVKRLDPHSVVASFPIDDDTVSFGRDPNCSVRLYYPTVSALHAKIVFQDKKAFLIVLGTHGLLIDGCQVYPSDNTSGSSSVKQNTIPLTNNSEIEIHKKRFIFTYPPKDARPSPIISTPTPPTQSTHTPARVLTSQDQGTNTAQRTRTLRLSMIHSAQVFSPRPSADPATNLKVLQTPLKALQSRARSVSPDKKGGAKGSLMERLWEARVDAEMATAESGEEEDIVLVDGNHPRVVQEEKDLIILEDVPIPPSTPTSNLTPNSTPRSQTASSLLNTFPAIPPQPSPNSKTQTSPPITLHLRPAQHTQQTSPPLSQLPQFQSPSNSQSPRRLGPTKASLHKAVLIRSAQRAIMRAEAEAGASMGAAAGMNVDMDADVEMRSVEDEDGRELNGIGDEEEDDEAEEREVAAFAVGGATSESENEDGGERAEEEEEEGEDREDEEEEKPKSRSVWRKSWENLVGLVRSSSVTRDDEDQDEDREQDTHGASSDEEVEVEAQGAHKTPQARPNAQQYSKTYQRAVGLGGFMTPQAPSRGRGSVVGAGRYSVDGMRRVPSERETEREDGAFGGARRVRLETKWKVGDIVVPAKKETEGYNKEGEKTPLRGTGRVSEEERKAIQERRRSALKTPDTFFGGQAPGIRAAMLGSTPSKSAIGGKARASPYKGQHKIGSGNNNNGNEGGKDGEGEEEEEDTKALLEKMKETVEGMKRRRSGVPGGRISVVDIRSGQDGGVDAMMNVDEAGEEDKEESDKKNATEGDAMVVHEDAHASSTDPPSGPKTPSFKNIREQFQNLSDRPVIAEPKTPKMEGMRDLFREKKVLATPAFEGVGEMMKTPKGWRMDVLEEGAEGEEDEEEKEVVAKSTRRGRGTPASASSSSSATKPPSSTKSTTTRRKTTRSAAIKTPVTEGKSNFADDEATPGDVLGRVEEVDDDKDKNKEGKGKKQAARKGRSKAPVVDSDAEEGGPGGEKVQKKARLIRGSRKVVDDIPEEPGEQPKNSRSRKAQSEESADVVEATKPPPTRKTKSAARSKTAAITTDDEGTSSKSARRTAKTADSGVSASEDSVAPPTKLGRKTQTRTQKTQAAVSESEPEPFVKKTAPRKGRAGARTTDDESVDMGTGTGKRVTRAKAAEVEETEEDPLDSIDTPDEPPAVTKGKRVARSRTATAETAKEEESAEEETGGTGKKTTTRKGTGKKVAVAAATAMPGLAESEDGVDKENTPSVDDEDLPVKTKRGIKAKKGVKAAVVAEGTDGAFEVVVAKPKSTRTTRARK